MWKQKQLMDDDSSNDQYQKSVKYFIELPVKPTADP